MCRSDRVMWVAVAVGFDESLYQKYLSRTRKHRVFFSSELCTNVRIDVDMIVSAYDV